MAEGGHSPYDGHGMADGTAAWRRAQQRWREPGPRAFGSLGASGSTRPFDRARAFSGGGGYAVRDGFGPGGYGSMGAYPGAGYGADSGSAARGIGTYGPGGDYRSAADDVLSAGVAQGPLTGLSAGVDRWRGFTSAGLDTPALRGGFREGLRGAAAPRSGGFERSGRRYGPY